MNLFPTTVDDKRDEMNDWRMIWKWDEQNEGSLDDEMNVLGKEMKTLDQLLSDECLGR